MSERLTSIVAIALEDSVVWPDPDTSIHDDDELNKSLAANGYALVEIMPPQGDDVWAGSRVREVWACAARKQSLPEPADCDWPVCGCDPYASKVISALQESGLLKEHPVTPQP